MIVKLPLRLAPGTSVTIGDARAELSPDGSFKACDRYDCAEALVPTDVPVVMVPVPAIYRLLAVTPFIYIEFNRRAHVDADERTYWTLAPIELEVNIDNLTLVRLSPLRVKFTLVGQVADGIIARYFKAPIARSPTDLPYIPGTALLCFKVSGTSALLPGIGFNASQAVLYADDEGRLYYSVLQATTDGENLTVKTDTHPPIRTLRYVASHPHKRHSLGLTTSFSMKIEVVRPRHTTP